MTPEQLKVIANGLGYAVDYYQGQYYKSNQYCGENWNLVTYYKNADVYNPLTNNDQMVEIMEKHLQRIEVKNVAFGKWEVLIAGHEGWGKTINEAVCNAAYEYFKNAQLS